MGIVATKVFADDTVLYTENSQVSTKNNNNNYICILEWINWFSKVVGYKINLKKYIVFLWSNVLSKKDIFYNSNLNHTPKKNKIPRNKLNQGKERPILWKL